MSSPRLNDPRVKEIIKHLRILARRHNRRLVVQDYLEYRARHAPQLPALTTIYRLMGSWPEALKIAGVDQGLVSDGASRTSDESLIAALKQAATDLGVTVLSSHAYDEYRKTQAPDLPSSSVIRKWLGRWGDAVKLAGLETTERTMPHRPSMAEIIAALRQAKEAEGGVLTPRAYGAYHNDLPIDEQAQFPEVGQVMSQFPSWEMALRAADVDQSDSLHPTGLWTAEEARRISSQCEKLTGQPLVESSYEDLRRRAKRPMPSWRVLRDLLSS